MILRVLGRARLWLMIPLGSLVALGGLSSLALDPAPNSLPVVDLESGRAVDSQYLHVADGALYWAKLVMYAQTNRDSGEEVATLHHHVPLVSGETAARWDSLLESARAIEPPPVVLIRFSDDPLRSSFPNVVTEASLAMTGPYTASGKISIDWFLPPGVRDQVEREMGIASQDALVLRDGDLPLTKGEAASVSIVSLGLVTGGWWWRRSDVRKAMWRLSLEDQVMAGAAEGADAGIDAGIAQGLQDAISLDGARRRCAAWGRWPIGRPSEPLGGCQPSFTTLRSRGQLLLLSRGLAAEQASRRHRRPLSTQDGGRSNAC